MDKRILTYSALRDFRNCRRRYYYRNVLELAPVRTDPNLRIGSLFHECLERWAGLELAGQARDERAVEAILTYLDEAYPNRAGDTEQNRQWHLSRAMFLAYARKYRDEVFDVVGVEKTFSCPIWNPSTGHISRTFVMAGKVDLLVRMRESGEYFVVEHKTASQISGDYIERLPLDFQVHIYAHFLARATGLPIAGVLYDAVCKAQLKQKVGETDEEFAVRRAELIAKSKNGTTSATQRQGESDDEFQARLAEKYLEPDMFHREALYLSATDTQELVAEVWELTQQLLTAYRSNRWYRNDSMCFQPGRTCPYVPLCRCGGNPNLVENLYEHRLAHTELNTCSEDTPAF